LKILPGKLRRGSSKITERVGHPRRWAAPQWKKVRPQRDSKSVELRALEANQRD